MAAVPMITSAADETGTQGTAGLDLVMPTSYEQYLELNAPTDMAFHENYIAIADNLSSSEAAIYIYDRNAQEYRSVKITTPNKISSLNFYDCESGTYLYYILTGNFLYRIDLSDAALIPTLENSIRPSVMLIHNDTEVYYATQTGESSNLYYSTITDLTISEGNQIGASPLTTQKPAFSEFGNTVYVSENKTIYECTKDSFTSRFSTIDSANNFAILGTSNYELLYSNPGGMLYYGNEQQARAQGCSVIKYFEGEVYVLTEDGVAKFDISSKQFTDYRISKYSDADNRLAQGAADLSVYGDTLIVADKGNKRIQIFNTRTQAYSAVTDLDFSPELLCAGAQAFAVSDTYQIRLYKYDGTLLKRYEANSFSSTIYGIAYSYGNFYVVTGGNNNAYILSENGEAFKAGSNRNTATSIAADIFGNIYIVQDDSVYYYTQGNFATEISGELLISFPEAPKKLLSDYEGNLYALTGSTIYRYSKQEQTIRAYDLTAQLNKLVYNPSGSQAVSFAFGFENRQAYVLSDGFIAKTDDLDTASLDNLDAAQAYESIYSTRPDASFASDRLVRAYAGCIRVTIDIQALENQNPTLSCGEYAQLDRERTGVVLAETEYGIIALFYDRTVDASGIQTTRSYEVCLLLKGSRYETLGDTCFTAQEYEATISNDVGFYKYPAMRTGSDGNFEALGKQFVLSQGTRVTVLGALVPDAGVLDAASYSFLCVKNENGIFYGFVPTSYLIESGESSTDSAPFVYRNLRKGASVTLFFGNESIQLNDRERLKAFGEADDSGLILVAFDALDGNTYTGKIDASLLEKEDNSIIAVLIIVPAVTLVVLASVCYLVLRKQPTLQ